MEQILLNCVYFILSALLLWFGAEWIVESASAIARKFKVSELVIGLTIVALGTSAPEFLVTVTAAFQGVADISLSNVVGSNIFNLGFILGSMALIKPIPTNPALVYQGGLVLFVVTVLMLLMGQDSLLGLYDGIFLMSCLGTYIIFLFYSARKGNANLPVELCEGDECRVADWKDYPKLILGFAAIAGGGHLMVTAATDMALMLGVSRWVIGVTIVAAGTSLPELVTCLAAARKGRNDMLLGNLLGSDFFNFAGVLGLTCLMRPLAISPEAMPNLYLLVGMVGVVIIFMRTGWRISRWEGALLVGVNLVRWGMDFYK
ncbi:MAG: calcium/sodium antiporter [Desulfovibrio sp.]